MTTDTMLEYHLQYNHFPPQPVGLVPFAAKAIELANDDDLDGFVEIPTDQGVQALVRDHGDYVTARELVDELHLEGFLEEVEP